MPEEVTIWVNGRALRAAPWSTVAAVLLTAGIPCRKSVSGEARTALCGMGICFECRATVNGLEHTRTCLLICEDGMVVETER
jgi:hypothetical protein